MKIHILSNAPWAQTGYGCQTRINAPKMVEDGHDVKITAFYGLEGGVLTWGGIPVMPRYRQAYGQDIIGLHAIDADVMISLIDAWVCEPERWPHLKWCPWFPIDGEPLSPFLRLKIEKAYHRIVMSKFGCRIMDEAGLDYTYVPHSIDTQMFKPVDREQARKVLGFDQDKFIIGMVAANKGAPSRKAFTQQIRAFAEFRKNHKDAIMYIHACTAEHGENGGVNLIEYSKFVGLKPGVDILFPDQYQLIVGYPDEHMNLLYNSFDVHTLVSTGEGFGIPIIEAQAAGCPVVVGAWTSMEELCFSGWKVEKADAEPEWTALGTYQYRAHVPAIVDKYEQAYKKWGNKIMRQNARTAAMEYDTQKVYDNYWKPTLKAIQDKLDREKAAEDRVELVKF